MEESQKAELKNDVLKFLIKDGRRFDTDWLFIILGKPVKSTIYFKEIIIEMCNEANKYLNKFEDSPWLFISSNNLTQDFLESGGFVVQYDNENKVNQEMQRLA